MSRKKRRGRPIGGKAPPSVRKYWREKQREARAKKKRAKKKKKRHPGETK